MPIKIPSTFFEGSKPVALVANGGGFLGSHICEELIDKDIRVLCFEDWQNGSKQNLNLISNSPNFFLVERSLLKKIPKSLKKLDYIIYVSVVESYLNNEEVTLEKLETNSTEIKRLLLLAKRRGAKFLLLSVERPLVVQEAKSGLSHFDLRKLSEANVFEYSDEKNVNARVLRIGDLYGPRMKLNRNNPLGEIFKCSLYGEILDLSKFDNLDLFPTYIRNVTDAVTETLFRTGTKGKTVSLVCQNYNAKEIVEIIKFLGFPIKTERTNKTGTFDNINQVQANSNLELGATTSLKEGIEMTLNWLGANSKREIVFKPAPIVGQKQEPLQKKNSNLPSFLTGFKKSLNRPSLNPKSLSGIGFWGDDSKKVQIKTINRGSFIWQKVFVTTVLLLPILWLFMFPFLEFGLGMAGVNKSKELLLKGDSKSAENWSSQAEYLFSLSAQGFEQWNKIPFLENPSGKFRDEAKLFESVAGLVKSSSATFRAGQDLIEGITGEETYLIGDRTDNLSFELKNIEKQLGFLETEVGKSKILSSLLQEKNIQKQDLATWRKSAAGMADLLPYLSQLLGAEGKKTYLILFQNNSELRPTGGFIGSFGLVEFNKGRMVSLDVFDVYTADGQLKGHVEPPEAIKKYLGEASWYLRDSNWSPDFPTSAARASWFLEKEMGYKVNGVIALDLEFLKSYLSKTGPIILNDTGEEITERNVYEKIQSQAEKEFFPGSTNKKDYLTSISKAVLNGLAEASPDKLTAFAYALSNSLETRHVNIWTDNSKANSVLNRNTWDGSIASISCSSKQTSNNCVSDYLHINEANLGVNKSNGFIERSYNLEISITQDKLFHRMTIYYKNNSTSGVWPGGDYKNYLRFYTNQGSEADSFTVFNPDLTLVTDQEIIKSQEKGKEVFEFLVFVPAGESRQVTFSWSNSLYNVENNGEYILYWQKQPGTLSDPLTLKINMPQRNTDSPVKAFPVPELTQGSLIGYNTSLTRDFTVNLIWQAKNTN